MKDLAQIWNRVTGRQYANAADREMREISNNRLKKFDIDTSALESNFSECEGLNNKFSDDIGFNQRKDAIINRLFERRKKGQVARYPKGLFMLLMFGFFALAGGCFIMFSHPYDFFFKLKVVLQDGGEIFEMWRKPQVDLYCRIFLFNITNAEEYMAGNDTKIKVEEIGPYVYKESLEHDVTKFNDNGTLSAIPRHPLTWMAELSEGRSEDDILFLPHIALLSIANVVSQQSFVTRLGLNHLISLTNSQPLAKMTAKEFMMGYKSGLMTLGNTFMPGWISFDKLGLIDRMYDFEGDFETIFTGENDVSTSGLIDTYRGSTNLPQWEGEHCSSIQYASDGTKFRGGVGRNESLLFFRKSLCRPAPLVAKGEGVKSNLNAVMYSFPDHMMDNGKYEEANKCFCRNGKCLPEGLIDVTECYYGFPIALSYPHFYKGDEVLFSKVEGLKPNRELHETRFWIQPDSGLPLDVSTKFQINMALEDISNIKNSERFANMYLPLLWFDIRMYTLPPAMEKRFNLYLNVLPSVEQGAMYMFFVAGAAMIIMAVYRLTFKVMFKSFDSKKKSNNIVLGQDLWIDRKKNRNAKDNIYAPCEIPLNETDMQDVQFDEEIRPAKLRLHTDKIKELSHRLSDKVYDSVGSMKDKVRDLTHVKNIFNNERRDSLIPKDESATNDNEAFRSDSSDTENDYKRSYEAVRQSDSEDECRYLEVIDDEFENSSTKFETDMSKQLVELDSSPHYKDEELIIHISD